MRRPAVVATFASLLLAGLGAARVVADVSPSPGDGSTVSVGQSLVFSVSDSYSGNIPNGAPYASCTANLGSQAVGRVSVGPLGPADGGTSWVTLSSACTGTNTWTFSGSVTVTVPADATSPVWASIAVQEVVPIVLDSNWTVNYSANYHYPLATASTSTTTTSASTGTTAGAPATTTGVTESTSTATSPAASTTTQPVTITVTQPATSTVTVVQATTSPAPSPPTTVTVLPTPQRGRVTLGKTILLDARTKTDRCRRGSEPDRRCSPGAYYAGATQHVICSPTFRTSSVQDVPEAEQHVVEAEYGLAPKSYGSTLEIDRIVALDLGGSNDIANLYPENARYPAGEQGYHAKDRLENRLHAMVCAGSITLSAARRGIASDWETLYARIFGAAAAR